MKNRTTAIILALFLGGLGIHRFYLNAPVRGFLYLIFCFTFIPAILGFCTGIRLMFMSDREFNAAYNKGISITYS